MNKEISNGLPASIDTERAILGAIMLDNVSYSEAASELTTDDFYLSSHVEIFRAMIELQESGRPVDIVTLHENLAKDRKVDKVGGVSYLASLTDGLPRRPSIAHYVKIVKEQAQRRRYFHELTAELEKVRDGNYDHVSDLAVSHERRIIDIVATKKQTQKVGEFIDQAYKDYWEQFANLSPERKAVGFRTGLAAADEFTTGYRKRELNIIGGYPSHGKSSWMRQSVIAQMFDDVKALVFSKEVSKEQFLWNTAAAMADIPPDHLRDGRLMDMNERARLKEFLEMARKWNLWVDDSNGLHVRELCAKARHLIRKQGVEIVYIDYLQLLDGDGNNSTEKIEDVSSNLWRLMDTEKIALIVVSALNRKDSQKKLVKPYIQLLKGASKLEYDANNVAFTWIPEDADGIPTGEDEIIFAKQKNGSRGFLKVRYNENLLFEERE